MIPVQEFNRVRTSGTLETIPFSLSHSDGAHILHMLRNKTYRKKLLAVVREISTNARDAHVEAGKADKPIDVHLPTSSKPTLMIGDYGAGLSPEDVRTIYTSFGRSTKRNSNEATGFLGIGSKSPFAYTDTWTIVSHHGGNVYTYQAHANREGTGAISLLATQPSARTGVEIHIPIQQKDIEEVLSISRKFFSYWARPPKFNLANFKLDHGRGDTVLKGDSWYMTQQGNPTVVMGDVPYEIDMEALLGTNTQKYYWQPKTITEIWLASKPVMTVPLGSVDVVISREELEYNDRTKRFLKAHFLKLHEAAVAAIEALFVNAKTPWEARKIVISLPRNTAWRNSVLAKGVLKAQHPQVLKSVNCGDQYPVAYYASAHAHETNPQGYTTRLAPEHWSEKTQLFAVDNKTAWRRKLQATTDGPSLVWRPSLECEDIKAELTAWLAENNLTGIPIIFSSTVEYKRKKGVSSANKHGSVLLAPLHGRRWHSATPSSDWQRTDLDPVNGQGFYVTLDSYRNYFWTPHDITSMNLLLTEANIDRPLAAVRKQEADTLGAGWLDLTKPENFETLLGLFPEIKAYYNDLAAYNRLIAASDWLRISMPRILSCSQTSSTSQRSLPPSVAQLCADLGENHDVSLAIKAFGQTMNTKPPKLPNKFRFLHNQLNRYEYQRARVTNQTQTYPLLTGHTLALGDPTVRKHILLYVKAIDNDKSTDHPNQ